MIAGPAITPGGIDFADVVARRRSAARGPVPTDPAPLRSGDLRWVLANLSVHLERWLSGGRSAITTGEIELDPADLSESRRPILPVPDRVRPVPAVTDPGAGKRVTPWVHDLPDRSWDDLPSFGERRLKAYQDRVEARGFEVISVDLTTCDVAAAGLHVTHTLVPGLVSPFPAGLPSWGGRMIANAAVTLGWRARRLAERDPQRHPLPCV
ncbi:hypothetical protein [Amycolatopsis sp. cmx-11-51]|uniref:hypothetical protein n=1 Tax=unclassified Amycolatopsis TaxID=2618356 RepID=UPI0039E26EDC